MTDALRLAAVDLGATSGRVMLGQVGPGTLDVREVHRFGNEPVRLGSALHWDVLGLYRETMEGLRAAGGIDGIGIDGWAVDYGLLDGTGALLGNPVHYRDPRTAGVPDAVHRTVSATELYDVTGLQQLPFNTLYQIASEVDSDRLRVAETLLMIPDLLGYWLTGATGAEHTNASTTGLYDARARRWAPDVAARVGIPVRLLPPLRSAGDLIGTTTPGTTTELAAPGPVPVVAVGSHDTASAVLGVPATPATRFAYISSGTWSLVGVELTEPLLTAAARTAGLGNEAGVDGTTRLLRNVMGLWVLSETLRTWRAQGHPRDIDAALAAAADAPAFGSIVDIDAPTFLAPGDMPARIAAACRDSGQAPPRSRGEVVRCVLEGLAMAYRRTLRLITTVTGHLVDVVHIVGGGAHNELLCALTADACGVPVIAGPVEAAAFGNILVQARTLGAELTDRWSMRALIRDTQRTRTYRPTSRSARWDAVEARCAALGVWS